MTYVQSMQGEECTYALMQSEELYFSVLYD